MREIVTKKLDTNADVRRQNSLSKIIECELDETKCDEHLNTSISRQSWEIARVSQTPDTEPLYSKIEKRVDSGEVKSVERSREVISSKDDIDEPTDKDKSFEIITSLDYIMSEMENEIERQRKLSGTPQKSIETFDEIDCSNTQLNVSQCTEDSTRTDLDIPLLNQRAHQKTRKMRIPNQLGGTIEVSGFDLALSRFGWATHGTLFCHCFTVCK